MIGESLLWQILNEALEIILLFDEKGYILFANHHAYKELSFSQGEMEGMSILEIFPNDIRLLTGGLMDEGVADGRERAMTAYRKNKTCFSALAKICKTGSYYICMAYDTSKSDFLERELVKVKQESENALKVKSEFVSNVTHELRTPVNGILGNTRELLEIEQDNKKLRNLNLIEHGCRDMHNIIKNILDFSKLEAGKFLLEPQKFEFRNMMDYVKANHINIITEKGLEFFVTVSPTVPQFVIADELRIVQILNNLLSNASKFTSVGKITLEVVKTAQVAGRAELFFFVMDTGIGIDAADQDKLFKSFSQVDASISRKFGGTGLGLNITKQLVELMGGSINVQSQKGKGSTFSFSIWVDLTEEDTKETATVSKESIESLLLSAQNDDSEQQTREYGTEANIAEIKQKVSKLVQSDEMENWEKAEMFVDGIKQLTETAPREIKNAILKMKMAVQKENYEKAMMALATFEEMLDGQKEVE